MERTLKHSIAVLALAALAAFPAAAEEPFAPYGTAKVDMHPMAKTNVVFDVNYDDPRKLDILYGFVKNTRRETRGEVIVVTHGPELRAFAKENYEKYQAVVDEMAQLAKEDGVVFKLCGNALRAAGYEVEDMHGFASVVPAGFPEIAYWQSLGYKYVFPAPYNVRDARKLDR